MSVVVVGIDGSDESMNALQFAATEARLRQVPLRVVHGFTIPAAVTWTGGPVVGPEPFEHIARHLVDDTLTAVGSDLEGIDVERVVEIGGAVSVLLNHASTDDLIVVGSRGRGGFKGLLLGSVSQQVVVHAPCPVVVVRGADD
jgi:nucleotide-binding universal stress UspA family protein